MGKDSLTRYIQRRCFNRNEIKEDAWETIWSRSAMRDDGDNVFVIRCLDSTILDKATEDFTKFKLEDPAEQECVACQTEENNNNIEKLLVVNEEKECQTDKEPKEEDQSPDEKNTGYTRLFGIASFVFLAYLIFTFFGKAKSNGREFYPLTWMSWMPEPVALVEVNVEHEVVSY